MTEKCNQCGKFIPWSDIEGGLCAHEFEPLNEFGPEVSNWYCANCTIAERKEREGG